MKDIWPAYFNDTCIHHESLPKEIPLVASKGVVNVLGVCGTNVTHPTPAPFPAALTLHFL